jgi:hypothetical protein
VLLGVLGTVLVVYFMLNRPVKKRYQWTESYKASSEQPYGTQIIQKLLAGYRPGQPFSINDKLPLRQLLDTSLIKKKTDYVFIGTTIFLDDADKKALLTFISSGNDAFVASVDLPYPLLDSAFVPECDRSIAPTKDTAASVTMNFYNSSLRTSKGYTYRYRFGETDQPYFWSSLDPELFCDSTKLITPIGFIYPDKVNFFKIPFGKGNLYVHCNPLVFTNYFLIHKEKTEYAAGVFSHLGGESIIWDEFSRSPFSLNNAPPVSPLSYILRQDSLRYAWWLILVTAVLYVVFAARRKQRVIPVLEEKANTSLEFVNMISVLHFQNSNPHDIARKKMRYFFYFIRARFGIHTQSLTEAQVIRLAEKSKMEMETLQVIHREFSRVENQRYYDTHRLVDLYEALDTFYKHCK